MHNIGGVEKLKNREENLGGLKYILAGLTLMAIGIAAVEIICLFKIITILNWAKMAVEAIGWILVIVGLFMLKNTRVEFKRSCILSVLGIVMLAGSGLLAFMYYRNGLGETAFIDIKVMFAAYLADLSMIGVYFLVVRGMGQLAAKAGNGKLGANSIRLTRMAVAAILVSMVLVPFSYALPTVLKFIVGILAIALGLVAEISMIIYSNQSYKSI